MDKRKLILSTAVSLVPMLLGIILWNALPDMLIRQVGAFSSKTTVVFLFPIMFVIIHLLICIKPDWMNIPQRKKYWHVPIASNIFFVICYYLSIFHLA